MRQIIAALIVTLGLVRVAGAFEIEEEVFFPAPEATETLQILSTADKDLFAPTIRAFQMQNPSVAVNYTITGSSEIMRAVVDEGKTFDIVISSAMDLQTKLANDGFARAYQSDATVLLPDWGNWRDSVFAFTQEPATIVLSRAAFEGLPTPRTRQDLLQLLRDNRDRFENKVGTYDIRQSGLGYLFATQDSRISDTYWRFTEALGSTGVKLYCCSSDMIDHVLSGEIAVAYNVLGSYAVAREDAQQDILIIEPEDYTTVMLRSALLMHRSDAAGSAESFLDFLLLAAWEAPEDDSFRFPNKAQEEVDRTTRLRPIRLGPGLLVFLDRFKKDRFIREWESSILR
jgi:iron(III) transport system substrate-binding protein